MQLANTVALVCLAVTAVPMTSAKPTFVSLIPNGDGVDGVAAVGHVSASGGGPRNAFGKAFMDAGKEWTKELCQADSDGDGQTNGQELGDPCCEWTTGKTPSFTKGVSHPGDATKKADPTLWAAAKCASGSSNGTSSSSTSKAPSSATTPSSAPAASKSSAASTLGAVGGVVGTLTALAALAQA